MLHGSGSWIDACFSKGKQTLKSTKPAHAFELLFETSYDLEHVEQAVVSAKNAQKQWSALSFAERYQHLERLREAFVKHADSLTEAVLLETGKPLREAKAEAGSCANRIKLIASSGLSRIASERLPNVHGSATPHPQGVVAVLGPFNFPLHLMNSHIIPALLTGNTVVLKPSEFAPLCAERYAKCVEEAGLPAGVFNMVQGGGDVGAALVEHENIDAILFTGSYPTGRKIAQRALDFPNKVVALEMGGKNCVYVHDDADIDQALVSIVQGAFQSTGQRCTATSRVLIHKDNAEALIAKLQSTIATLRPSQPDAETCAFGPLANESTYKRFKLMRSNIQGCDILVAGDDVGKGAFVTPSLHLLSDPKAAESYLNEELFGPDICVEIVEDLDHGISRLNANTFGLANSLFSKSKDVYDRVFNETRSGILNWNRSTNGANGALPFGGVGKSGNQRPAGIDAVRYTTYPVASLQSPFGKKEIDGHFRSVFSDSLDAKENDFETPCSTQQLIMRHQIESLFEKYRFFADRVNGPHLYYTTKSFEDRLPYGLKSFEQTTLYQTGGFVREGDEFRITSLELGPDRARGFLEPLETALKVFSGHRPETILGTRIQGVQRPEDGFMPRSQMFLERMYKNNFVPKERKTPVVDLNNSEGPFLSSVDEQPLILLDAASQIASLGLGFNDSAFRKALHEGELEALTLSNSEWIDGEDELVQRFKETLLQHTWEPMQHISFTHGGAEADEKAFDLCRVNGPGGKRIIAFEGSFHGRTMMSIHATYNPVKRAPFEFKGYEVRYVPFPKWRDPRREPEVNDAWIQTWSEGRAPEKDDDILRNSEIDSLIAMNEAIEKGDVCCVIVEPMQGEGGDNYATARFYNGLRALTRCHGIPLVFDEVQVGFGLGGPFFWHELFDLRDKDGNPEGPECVTTAKKAQTGACLSVWPDSRPSVPHRLQVARGLLHAKGVLTADWVSLEHWVKTRLFKMARTLPQIVTNPRCVAYAFAFDLPSRHLAMEFVKQRFYRGFMVYIAGERTVRFRLSASWKPATLDILFREIEAALRAFLKPALVQMHDQDLDPSVVMPEWDNRALPAQTRSCRQSSIGAILSMSQTTLESWCDHRLYHEGQCDNYDLQKSLKAVDEKQEAAKVTPRHIISTLQKGLSQSNNEKDFEAQWSSRLGMPVKSFLAQALGARIARFDQSAWSYFSEDIMMIESQTYEEGRQDSPAELERMICEPSGITLLATRRTDTGPELLGYALGGAVESYTADGCKEDFTRGQGTTFYSSNISLRASAQGSRVGTRLKLAQLKTVRDLRNDDGAPKYLFMTGRNRVGQTLEMGAINSKLGAYVDTHFKGNQYGDASGEAIYYRIPLHGNEVWPQRAEPQKVEEKSEFIRLDDSIHAPLGARHERLIRAFRQGEFSPALGSKLTLSNWVTPNVVRYSELLRELAPAGLTHSYFTSGRAELIDKGVRSFRVQRPRAQKALTLTQQYFGTISAAARSLTDPSDYQAPFSFFDWPRIKHPALDGDIARALSEIETEIQDDPENFLAIVVEPIGEMSGLVLQDEFLVGLGKLRETYGVPIVFCETASALGRNGKALWFSDTSPIKPNMVLWYTGGQLGNIFVDDDFFVKKPLTLISTWDGDEVALLRARHALEEAYAIKTHENATAFDEAFEEAFKDTKTLGQGFWKGIEFEDIAARDAFIKKARAQNIVLKPGFGARVLFAPALTTRHNEFKHWLSPLALL